MSDSLTQAKKDEVELLVFQWLQRICEEELNDRLRPFSRDLVPGCVCFAPISSVDEVGVILSELEGYITLYWCDRSLDDPLAVEYMLRIVNDKKILKQDDKMYVVWFSIPFFVKVSTTDD